MSKDSGQCRCVDLSFANSNLRHKVKVGTHKLSILSDFHYTFMIKVIGTFEAKSDVADKFYEELSLSTDATAIVTDQCDLCRKNHSNSSNTLEFSAFISDLFNNELCAICSITYATSVAQDYFECEAVLCPIGKSRSMIHIDSCSKSNISHNDYFDLINVPEQSASRLLQICQQYLTPQKLVQNKCNTPVGVDPVSSSKENMRLAPRDPQQRRRQQHKPPETKLLKLQRRSVRAQRLISSLQKSDPSNPDLKQLKRKRTPSPLDQQLRKPINIDTLDPYSSDSSWNRLSQQTPSSQEPNQVFMEGNSSSVEASSCCPSDSERSGFDLTGRNDMDSPVSTSQDSVFKQTGLAATQVPSPKCQRGEGGIAMNDDSCCFFPVETAEAKEDKNTENISEFTDHCYPMSDYFSNSHNPDSFVSKMTDANSMYVSASGFTDDDDDDLPLPQVLGPLVSQPVSGDSPKLESVSKGLFQSVMSVAYSLRKGCEQISTLFSPTEKKDNTSPSSTCDKTSTKGNNQSDSSTILKFSTNIQEESVVEDKAGGHYKYVFNEQSKGDTTISVSSATMQTLHSSITGDTGDTADVVIVGDDYTTKKKGFAESGEGSVENEEVKNNELKTESLNVCVNPFHVPNEEEIKAFHQMREKLSKLPKNLFKLVENCVLYKRSNPVDCGYEFCQFLLKMKTSKKDNKSEEIDGKINKLIMKVRKVLKVVFALKAGEDKIFLRMVSSLAIIHIFFQLEFFRSLANQSNEENSTFDNRLIISTFSASTGENQIQRENALNMLENEGYKSEFTGISDSLNPSFQQLADSVDSGLSRLSVILTSPALLPEDAAWLCSSKKLQKLVEHKVAEQEKSDFPHRVLVDLIKRQYGKSSFFSMIEGEVNQFDYEYLQKKISPQKEKQDVIREITKSKIDFEDIAESNSNTEIEKPTNLYKNIQNSQESLESLSNNTKNIKENEQIIRETSNQGLEPTTGLGKRKNSLISTRQNHINGHRIDMGVRRRVTFRPREVEEHRQKQLQIQRQQQANLQHQKFTGSNRNHGLPTPSTKRSRSSSGDHSLSSNSRGYRSLQAQQTPRGPSTDVIAATPYSQQGKTVIQATPLSQLGKGFLEASPGIQEWVAPSKTLIEETPMHKLYSEQHSPSPAVPPTPNSSTGGMSGDGLHGHHSPASYSNRKSVSDHLLTSPSLPPTRPSSNTRARNMLPPSGDFHSFSPHIPRWHPLGSKSTRASAGRGLKPFPVIGVGSASGETGKSKHINSDSPPKSNKKLKRGIAAGSSTSPDFGGIVDFGEKGQGFRHLTNSDAISSPSQSQSQ